MTAKDKAALITAAIALLVTGERYLSAKVKAAELATARAYESYGEYTTDQLRRDEALLRALRDCQEERERRTTKSVAATIDPNHVEPQAQTVLDEIAKGEGWKP